VKIYKGKKWNEKKREAEELVREELPPQADQQTSIPQKKRLELLRQKKSKNVAFSKRDLATQVRKTKSEKGGGRGGPKSRRKNELTKGKKASRKSHKKQRRSFREALGEERSGRKLTKVRAECRNKGPGRKKRNTEMRVEAHYSDLRKAPVTITSYSFKNTQKMGKTRKISIEKNRAGKRWGREPLLGRGQSSRQEKIYKDTAAGSQDHS